jgi:hypothetical protein
MKDFSDDEIREILSDAGEELEDDTPDPYLTGIGLPGAAKPPIAPGLRKTAYEQAAPLMPPVGDTGVDPDIASVEALKSWKQVGQAGLAAAATRLGGGGPGAMALSGYFGRNDSPTSGAGAAQLLMNAATGPFAKFGNMGKLGQLGPFLRTMKDSAIGAGEVGSAQAIGDLINSATGQQATQEPLSPWMGAAAGGTGSGIVSALTGRFQKAAQQATPQVRDRMLSWIEQLRKGGVPDLPPTVNLAPMNSATIAQEAATLPKGALPANPYEHLAAKYSDRFPKPQSPAEPVNKLERQLEASLAAHGINLPPAKVSALAKPVPEAGPDPGTVSLDNMDAAIARILEQRPPALIQKLLGLKYPPAPSKPPATVSLTPPLKPAATPDPAPVPVTAAAAPERTIFDEADEYVKKLPRTFEDKGINDVIEAINARGVSSYIDKEIGGKDLSNLPQLKGRLETILPENGKAILRERILSKIMSGVGESGAFGDLSPIQKLKTFGGMDVGGKKGAQVINDVFDSPEATHHLNNLYEAAERTIEQQLHPDPKWANSLKVLYKSLPSIGMGGAGIPYLTFHFGPLGLAAGVAGTIAVSADKIGALVGRKRSKWSDMILDLVEGSGKYTPAQINALLSELRKLGEEE